MVVGFSCLIRDTFFSPLLYTEVCLFLLSSVTLFLIYVKELKLLLLSFFLIEKICVACSMHCIIPAHWQQCVKWVGVLFDLWSSCGYCMVIFMPWPAITHRRHYVFRLSGRLCVIKFVSMIAYKPLVGISPNLQRKCSWDKDELITFRGQKVKGQCHSKIFWQLTIHSRISSTGNFIHMRLWVLFRLYLL